MEEVLHQLIGGTHPTMDRVSTLIDGYIIMPMGVSIIMIVHDG